MIDNHMNILLENTMLNCSAKLIVLDKNLVIQYLNIEAKNFFKQYENFFKQVYMNFDTENLVNTQLIFIQIHLLKVWQQFNSLIQGEHLVVPIMIENQYKYFKIMPIFNPTSELIGYHLEIIDQQIEKKECEMIFKKLNHICNVLNHHDLLKNAIDRDQLKNNSMYLQRTIADVYDIYRLILTETKSFEKMIKKI